MVTDFQGRWGGHAAPARLCPRPSLPGPGPARPCPAPRPRPRARTGRRRRCGILYAMAPLLSRDLARAGTVTCAIAHATGALRALPGHVDGGAAVPGRPRRAQPRRAQPGPPREANPGQSPARTRRDFRVPAAISPNATIPPMTTALYWCWRVMQPFYPVCECETRNSSKASRGIAGRGIRASAVMRAWLRGRQAMRLSALPRRRTTPAASIGVIEGLLLASTAGAWLW